MSLAKAGAATAALFLMVQPCLAADTANSSNTYESRKAAFAGLQVRLPLGQRKRAKPTARLHLSSDQYVRGPSGAFVPMRRTPVLELGAGKTGKPTFYIAGQDSAEMQQKLNIGGTTTTLLIVGGVLLALVVVAAASTPPQVDFDD